MGSWDEAKQEALIELMEASTTLFGVWDIFGYDNDQTITDEI